MKIYNFENFFLSGLDESVSPFLSDSSKKWAKNLPLKTSLFSLFLFLLSYFTPNYLSFIFLTIIYSLLGTPAILTTLKTLQKIYVNINILMTLAAFLSLVLGKPFEGALLLILFGIANALEESVTHKTTNAMYHLNKIAPSIIFFIKDKKILQKSIKEIQVGDSILVKSQEVIPLDGVITKGTSFVSLEHLTGEALPVLKKPGDFVSAGAKNREGMLQIKVTKTGKFSTISQIIKLIASAQKQKPKIQKFFESFSKRYASTIILLSIALALFLPFFTNMLYLGKEGSIYRSLAFLIASSPCALVINTPTSYFSAINSCAKKGIILKKGAILDSLIKCKKIVFDKTGTLTKGTFKLYKIDKIFGSFDNRKALDIASSLSVGSTHPICQSLSLKKNSSYKIKNYESLPGYGIKADIFLGKKWQNAFFGSLKYIRNHYPLSKLPSLKTYNCTASFLWVDKNLFSFSFTDVIRKNIKNILTVLRKNFQLFLLTGDNKKNADFISKKLNIPAYSELNPKEKLKLIQKFSKKQDLVMVGDGINDAPCLKRASVGISLGKIGSKTAQDASDIILVNDDLTFLPWLFKKAKDTRKIILQNIFIAIFVILGTSIPALLGIIPLYVAVILHEGATLLVAVNSLRLLSTKNSSV